MSEALTYETLMRLAKQIEHEQSYDGDLPEIIRQCAERISELEDETEELRIDRDEWKTQHENLLTVRANDIAALLKRADVADRFAKINIGVAGKIAAENERLRAALASCDGSPTGRDAKRLDGEATTARSDEVGDANPSLAALRSPEEE